MQTGRFEVYHTGFMTLGNLVIHNPLLLIIHTLVTEINVTPWSYHPHYQQLGKQEI